MIDLTGMISIPYLKKTTFTGSEKGTNFMIRKISGEEGEPDKIQAVTWPGPFIFSVTEDEKKTYQEFGFSEDGILYTKRPGSFRGEKYFKSEYDR